VPAATPSLEMALELAYLISSQLEHERADLAGTEVHLWRFAGDEPESRPGVDVRLVARYVQCGG